MIRVRCDHPSTSQAHLPPVLANALPILHRRTTTFPTGTNYGINDQRSRETTGVDDAEGRMLRTSRYKYTIFNGDRPNREQLYDLKNDPGEMKNLADAPAHRETLTTHRRLLAAWCKETKDEAFGKIVAAK